MSRPTQNVLNEFIVKDKFADNLWEERGLNSSDPEISNRLNDLLNACANDLLQTSIDKFKNVLITHLNEIRPIKYDTEEREFIVDYFFELAEICSVEINSELQKWMYGDIPGLT